MLRVIGHADRILSEACPEIPTRFGTSASTFPDPRDLSGGSIRLVSRRESARDDAETYRVQDGLALGWLTVPLFTQSGCGYQLPVPSARELHPVPTIRVDSVIAFEPWETGCRLREYLRISAAAAARHRGGSDGLNPHRTVGRCGATSSIGRRPECGPISGLGRTVGERPVGQHAHSRRQLLGIFPGQVRVEVHHGVPDHERQLVAVQNSSVRSAYWHRRL